MADEKSKKTETKLSENVLNEISKEIKSLGEDTKELFESARNDIEQLRSDFEATGEETSQRAEALKESFMEKQETIEKILGEQKKEQEEIVLKLNDRLDQVELANKHSLKGGMTEEEKRDRFLEAKSFFEGMASRQDIKSVPASGFPDEKVDVEAYDGYLKAWKKYLNVRDEKVMSDSEVKLLYVGSDPDGGYTVPIATSNRIIEMIRESTPMRALASNETISTSSLEFPVDVDEAGSAWVGELSTRAETSTPQFGTQKIPVHENQAWPRATQKLLDDSQIDTEAWLAKKVAEKFSRDEATAFVTGDGVNRPRGFLTYPNGTSIPGQIEQVAMGAAATIPWDGLRTVKYHLKDAYWSNATWIMNRMTELHLMLLKDGEGRYIWQPMVQAGSANVLEGIPVRHGADMPTVAANALAVAIGDWRQAYLIVDRHGIRLLKDPFTATPQIIFKFFRRVGGDVINFEALKIGVVSL